MIDTGEKLPDYITLKNILILVTCLNKNNGKFYPQIMNKHNAKHLKKVKPRINANSF